MAPRQFTLGDSVRLALDPSLAINNPQDVYAISRTLPADANVWHYRVKRVSDGQERAVSESQILRLMVEDGKRQSISRVDVPDDWT